MFAIIDIRGDRCRLTLTIDDREALEALANASLVWDPTIPEERLLEEGFQPKLTRRLFRAVKACRESLA
jgi:hypothetical protein